MTKLTAADLDAQIASKIHASVPACCGACQQGRQTCPVPDACQISDAEYDFAIWRGLALGVAIVAACAIVTLLIATAL